MAKVIQLVPLAVATRMTVGQARTASLETGSRIFWRPDGIVNWLHPDDDLAERLEG